MVRVFATDYHEQSGSVSSDHLTNEIKKHHLVPFHGYALFRTAAGHRPQVAVVHEKSISEKVDLVRAISVDAEAQCSRQQALCGKGLMR